jgi:hypothetical protein
VLVSVVGLMSVSPWGGEESARGSRGARVRTDSDRAGCSSFRIVRVVRAGQAGAGRAQSRCQQVRNASFHG